MSASEREIDEILRQVLGEAPGRHAPDAALEAQVESILAEGAAGLWQAAPAGGHGALATGHAARHELRREKTQKSEKTEHSEAIESSKKPKEENPPEEKRRAAALASGDTLAAITPWSERHAARRQADEQPAEERESLLDTLKKAEPPKNRAADLLPTQRAGQGTRVFPALTGDGAAPKTERERQLTGQLSLLEGEAPPAGEGAAPTAEAALEEAFEAGRQEKVRAFHMQPPENEPDEPMKTVEDDGEYHTPQDAEPLKYDLLRQRRGAVWRMALTLPLFLLSLVLALTPWFDLTNGLLLDNPAWLLGIYCGLLAAAALVHARSVCAGIAGLFRGAPGEAPAALALALALVQAVVAVCCGAGELAGMLVGPSALLCLLVKDAGLRLRWLRIYRNLQQLAEGGGQTAVVAMGDDKEAEAFELGRGLAVGTPRVAFCAKNERPGRFMYHSYAEDEAETAARLPLTLLPLFACAGAVLAARFVPALALPQRVMQIVSALCLAVCAALPFTALLAGGFVQYRICRSLRRESVLLTGYDAVDSFCKTEVLAVDAADLFPPGSIAIERVQTLSSESLDRSIRAIAAVVFHAGSPLKPLFEQVLQGKSLLLPQVDSLVYEEDMGLSAWVGETRVLVGSRSLMLRHGVLLPEVTFDRPVAAAPGEAAVYLSTGGSLSAIFLLRYTADPEVAAALRQAVATGLSLHVNTCDANVTREMICRLFRLPASAVRMMGPVAQQIYRKELEETRSPEAILCYTGNARQLCNGMVAARRLRSRARVAAVVQTLCLLACFGLFCAGLVTGGGGALSCLRLMGLQLVALAAALGLPELLCP